VNDDGFEDFDPDNEEHWPETEEVVRLLIERGCERIPPSLRHHARLDTPRDRKYRIGNPRFKYAYVAILAPDNEPVSPAMIDYYERNLYVTIRKPWLARRFPKAPG
jgi:hypothetical protein